MAKGSVPVGGGGPKGTFKQGAKPGGSRAVLPAATAPATRSPGPVLPNLTRLVAGGTVGVNSQPVGRKGRQ